MYVSKTDSTTNRTLLAGIFALIVWLISSPAYGEDGPDKQKLLFIEGEIRIRSEQCDPTLPADCALNSLRTLALALERSVVPFQDSTLETLRNEDVSEEKWEAMESLFSTDDPGERYNIAKDAEKILYGTGYAIAGTPARGERVEAHATFVIALLEQGQRFCANLKPEYKPPRCEVVTDKLTNAREYAKRAREAFADNMAVIDEIEQVVAERQGGSWWP